MPVYRVYYSIRGYLELDAKDEDEAEEAGLHQLVHNSNYGDIDDREVHCAEEISK